MTKYGKFYSKLFTFQKVYCIYLIVNYKMTNGLYSSAAAIHQQKDQQKLSTLSQQYFESYRIFSAYGHTSITFEKSLKANVEAKLK